MSTGENIKYYRKKKGLTQKKLAELTGIAEITIRQYEAGKYEPKPLNLIKIKNALGVELNQLSEIDLDIYNIAPDHNSYDNSASELRALMSNLNVDELTEGFHLKLKEQLEKHDMQVKSLKYSLVNLVLNLQQDLDNNENTKEIAESYKAKIQSLKAIMNYLQLQENFLKLNHEGQSKVMENIELISKIPEYTNRDKQ